MQTESIPNLLVLGLGNLLMNDDAAGLHAVYALQERYSNSDHFLILDGGTLGLDLLGYLEWADKLLILDAIDINAEPGAVALIEGDDIDTIFETKLSPHQMGLKDLLAAAELNDDRPGEITLLGIQAKSINMEMQLTPQVQVGLTKLVSEASLFIDDFFANCTAPQ